VLDAVDVVLVAELQRDGRATFQSLADRVGLSRTAVRTRVQRLLDSGTVRIIAVLHASVLGTGAIGHLAVAVDGPARHVAAAIARRPAVWLATLTAGSHPVIAEARVSDDLALAAEVDAVRSLPGVRAVEVFRAVTIVKDTYSVVAELTDPDLDEIDWQLLRELRKDGRAPYTRLSEVVGLSQAATRARAVRLIHNGVVRLTGVVDPAAVGSGEFAGLGIRVISDVATTARRIAELAGVTSVVTGFGRHDVVCSIDAPSRDVLVRTLEAVRAVPGVLVRETWHHLDIIKRVDSVDFPL
jgi:DNA-binding Lrp family transcriptional regulator